ncbi:MAG: gamma-glutamyltransferase [Armatimonadetes bacterium]|nr:gamma-glutamyltransferase [Armatimonadota bacterium]
MEKTRGVVAAGSRLTAEAGAAMLQNGGNAFDAVVASTMMSFLAESTLSGLGGSGFALAFEASSGKSFVLDFFSVAPRQPCGQELDFHRVECGYGTSGAEEVVHIGRASSAVPGNPVGLLELQQQYGRLPIREVVAPAVAACRQGVELTPEQALNNSIYRAVVTHTPEMQTFYMVDTEFKTAGSLMRLPELGDTLELLAEEGTRAFREGDLGRRIVEDQSSHGGLISFEDLRCYRTVRRRPLQFAEGKRVFLTNPPPSLGGTLIRLSRMLRSKVGLAGLRAFSTDELERIAEIMRWTEIARHEHGNDPDRLSALSVDGYLSELAGRLMASLGLPAGERPPPAPLKLAPSTTQISVLDADGNAVALTTSPGYLAGYFVPGTGMSMNNMMGEPDLNPDGFHRIPPGTRITSMMSPTLVLEDRAPVLSTGSGGGSRLRGAILQTLHRHLDRGMPLEEAVNSPRVHLAGGTLHVEPGFPDQAVEGLARRGYRLNRFESRDLYFGGTHTACRRNGQLTGAGDARREGAVCLV